ncbi:endolytic transglycosylase MltG [Pelagibacterium sp. 26DY04]|uniref:endolytic transglycosylase MltG n=1 Tax=unclassified Pelagibacterium TaxID=2623280 RepID=UPI0028167DF8|nr:MULTISPECIES: endolytic transglycosylase MltG [unclassified Pelagibacterium]WMT88400.1 endolytic transglycosylase MltG [Pelagibacterium sp. 26DY04]WMT90922.1 endolytic transglycosylase MltG [Pelagibacterium sp. H642]
MAERKKKNRRRSQNGFFEALNGLLTLVLLALLGVAGVAVYGATVFNADGPINEDRSFVVEPGNVLATVAQRLEEQGFISNADVFNYGSRLLRRGDDLRAGEFNIAANSSMFDIIRELTEGTPIQHQVVVPEGFTSWQVVERVNADPDLTGNIEVLPPEGSLLPGAYSYQRGDTRQSIIDSMTTAMDEALAEIWEGRDPDLPIETPAELVTLASIVERETGLAEERPRVAGVFVNRLNVGMRLQSDPTIIYGITLGQGSLGRGLRRSEIEQVTPYNTYQIDGLPPGPIANPGIESLRAVANPEEHDYLYFVAAGAVPTDGHVFAENYSDHQVNVAAYREIERAAAEAAAEAEAQAAMDEIAAEEAAEAGDETAEDEAAPEEGETVPTEGQ